MSKQDKSGRLRTGWWVFLGLALVTGFEFWLSAAMEGVLLYLTITSLVKAALIIQFFMHLPQVWRERAGQE